MQMVIDQYRNYDAGKNDRLNSGWVPAWNQSPQMTDKAYRDSVRARMRDLERNSDIAGGIIAALERNVIGKGITLQAKTDDESLNRIIEELWKEWCRPRNCDVTGAVSFSEMTRLIVRRKAVDGGIIILKRYTSVGVVPLQLQLFDVDELDSSWITPKVKGNQVVDGVEVNRYGKPQGYWLKPYMPDGSPGNQSIFVDAQDTILYFTPTRPGQLREMSQFAPTATRIRDINTYMETVSMKEKVAAMLALVIETDAPTSRGYGRGRPNEPEPLPGSGGYAGVELTPGMILPLKPGESAKPVMSAGQGGNAAEFVRLQQRLAGAGQGLSYEVVSRDMSQVNYSSARQGLIEDDGTFGIEQQELVDHVLREVYESFLISAVVSKAINIPGFWDKKRDWMRHLWIMPGKRWIDPQKEANGNRIALNTGQKTLAQITAEQGRDWREQIDEMARIASYAREKGVELPYGGDGNAASGDDEELYDDDEGDGGP